MNGPSAYMSNKRLSLSRKSPKKVPKQLKIDFSAKENAANSSSKTFIYPQEQLREKSDRRKPLSPVENVVEKHHGTVETTENNKLSQKTTNNFEENETLVDFQVTDKSDSDKGAKLQFFVDDKDEKVNSAVVENDEKESAAVVDVLCEDSLLSDDVEDEDPETIFKSNSSRNSKDIESVLHGEEPVIDSLTDSVSGKGDLMKQFGYDRRKSCILSQSSRESSQELSQNSQNKKQHNSKVGLSRKKCSGVGISSFLNKQNTTTKGTKSPQKITKMLEKLKDIPPPKTDHGISGSFSSDGCIDVDVLSNCCPRDESVVTPSPVNSSDRQNVIFLQLLSLKYLCFHQLCLLY